MKPKTILAGAVVVAAAVAVAAILFKLLIYGDDGDIVATDEVRQEKSVGEESGATALSANIVNRRKARGTNAVSRLKQRVRRVRLSVPIEDPYTPEERRLADDLQSATDENDLDAVRKEVEKIKKLGSADLKSEAMDALAFFGRAALSDLMQFVKDKDQEVVDAAADKIAFVLDEMEEDDNKFKTEVLSTILSFDGLCSEDAIETFVGQLESIGSGDELLAVQTLVDLIDSGTVGENVKKRAKEAYEFVTGEEYADFKKAERWFAEKADELAAEKAEEEAGDAESAEDARADADAAVDEE